MKPVNFDSKLHTISEIKDREDVLSYAEKEGYIDQEEMSDKEKWDYYLDSLANDNAYYDESLENYATNV